MGKDVKIGLMVGLGLLALIVIFWSSRPPEEEDIPAAMTTVAEKAPDVAKEPLGAVAESKKAQASDSAKAAPAKTESATAEGNIEGVSPTPPVLAGPATDAAKTMDAPAVVTAATGEATHTVAKGDTLYSIGHKYGVHWQRVFERNRDVLKRPQDLMIGQRLKIPSARTLPPAGQAAPKADVISAAMTVAPERKVEAPSVRTHKVGPGDTLYGLARRYFQDANKWKAILQANPNIQSHRLMVGQVLTIPAMP